MSDVTYMVGPGLSFFRSDGDLTITFNTTRPKVVDFELKLYDIFIPILGALIIMVNSVIVVSSGLILHTIGQRPRPTYVFLGNVAVADLLTGVAVIFGMFYPRDKRTEVVCAIEIGMTVSAILASAYSVGLIAIDRFLYILHGLRYQSFIKLYHARLMALLVWIFALTIGFLPAMGYRSDTNNGKICWFVVIEPPELILATTSIGLVPMILITILYSIILYHALKKISQLKAAARNVEGATVGSLRIFRGGRNSAAGNLSVISENSIENGCSDSEQLQSSCCCGLIARKSTKVHIGNVYNPSKWKAIKIVGLTTGAFFITWFPYFIASALYAKCDPKATPRFCDGLRIALASPLAILGLSNSLLNPIIYAWWHNGFRESIMKICRNRCADVEFFPSTDSSSCGRNAGGTRSTFLRKSHLRSDAEATEVETNPIVKSHAKINGQINRTGAKNSSYDSSETDEENNRRSMKENSNISELNPSSISTSV